MSKCLHNFVSSLAGVFGVVARQNGGQTFGKSFRQASTAVLPCVKHPDLFKGFETDFVEDPSMTQTISSLERAEKPEQISNSIDIVRLKTPIEDVSIGRDLCPHLLFVRRRIHHALLRATRKDMHVIIVGNPGIGKSVFQLYYLARIFNDKLYGSLSEDYFGNTTPPKVIVRQIGARFTQILFVEERRVVEMKGEPASLPRAFEPQDTILLFEPGEDMCEPGWYPSIPTSAYVSPNISRYKEFLKRGAQKLYNPTWDLDEVLSVARVMRCEPSFRDDMRHLYDDVEVEQRFNEFGGILRYCLPQRAEVLTEARAQRRLALLDANTNKLIRFDTIEHPDVSHHLAQFKVEITGPKPFQSATIDLINNDIRDKLRNEWLKVSFIEKIRALMRNDETGFMDKACQDLFEDVVAENLIRNSLLRQRMVNGKVRNENEDVNLRSIALPIKRVDGAVPRVNAMEDRVLYVPLKKNFPLGDMVWKHEHIVYVANATRQTTGVKRVAGVAAFVNELDVPVDCKVRVFIVPRNKMFNTLKVEVPSEVKDVVDVVVLEMPKDYGASNFGYDPSLLGA